MGTFDSIDESVVKNLNDKEAVILLHKLVRAEARRLSIAIDIISIPYEVDTPDGGVDAVIQTGHPVRGSELIFEGSTYYQVKSGKVIFSEKGMEDVLCESKKKDVPERPLKPKVQQTIENKGTLVLFLTGQSAPRVDDAIKYAKTVIEKRLPGSSPLIRIVQFDNILAILDSYLSLRLSLLKISDFAGITHGEWSGQGSMRNYFEKDRQRLGIVDNIRTLARSTEAGDRIIRVIGYPGVGKTRSVLEALREDDLAPLVIYFDRPSIVRDTNFLTQLVRNEEEAIVVIDECDSLSYTQFVSALASAKSNIKLITVYNEEWGAVSGAKLIDLNHNEKLSPESIIAIMKGYQVPDDVAQRWEPFCDGSPRVAHMIAENLRRDANILENPSYDRAMERILANTDQISSDTFTKRKTVISWPALFHKFGWSRSFAEERKFILHKIMEKTGYSEHDVEEVVNELKKRKVLQGDKTLYISPRLLHIRAWVWWWEQNGDNFDLNDMKCVIFNGETTVMTSELYDWYTQMFEYAREVQGASEVVQKLLSLDGPLSNEPKLIEALGGNFFRGLAMADPENALLLLEDWFDRKTDDELRATAFDRMNLVRSLEGIAIWKDLFVRAAELMLRLAATEENHTYSNNSEGTFAELFSNGYGKVASTEAHPSDRLPVLRRALDSGDDRRQLMAINAIDRGLESSHFTKIMGAETQGLRKEPNFWMPATNGELWDAFRNVWNLLLEFVPNLSVDLKTEAVNTISNNIRTLILHTGHGEQYMTDYISLVKNGTIPVGAAIDFVNTILRFDSERTSDNVLKLVKDLAEYLEGDNLTSQLKRYIAHNSPDDWWGEDEDVKRSEAKVAKLVQEIIDEPSTLDDNDWLFTKEAQNSYRLGRGISDADTSNKLIDTILRLQLASDKKHGEDSTFVFVAGYLMGLYQRDKTEWQKTLDRIYDSRALKRWYAEACWRSHLDDRSAERILEQLKNGVINFEHMNMFRYGAMIKDLSSATFHRWVEYLLSVDTLESVAIAIDLYASYYVPREKKDLPVDLTLRLITSSALKEKNDSVARRIDYDWAMIAERFIEQNPDRISDLFEFLLSNFDKEKTVFGSYGDYVKGVMNKIVIINPVESWKHVAKYLEKEDRSWWLEMSWLGGGASFDDGNDGAIALFPKELVLSWIDEKPSKRANKIAYMMPHDYDHEDGEESWYASVLNRYGDNRSVVNSVMANFGTEGFSGPSSLHYAKKVEKIKRFGELHKDSTNIQAWVNRVVSQLNTQVQQAREEEERRGY